MFNERSNNMPHVGERGGDPLDKTQENIIGVPGFEAKGGGRHGGGGGVSSETVEFLIKNKERIGRHLIFYTSGDPLGKTATGTINEVEIENTLKRMGYKVESLSPADLKKLGEEVLTSATDFLDEIGADRRSLDNPQTMLLAQSEWLDYMSKVPGGKWAGEIYEARKHLSSPENVIEYQKAIGRHLQSREIPDVIKEVLKHELTQLKEGEVFNIQTTEQALDFLRQLASQQALKGVDALNVEVYSAEYGQKARNLLFRKFPDLEKLFRAEVDLKDSITKVFGEWKKLGDNAHALFRSFVDDKEKVQPRSMPDLSLGKLEALFKLQTSFGDGSYGHLVSEAMRLVLLDIENADREITAGVARTSLNPYTDQMEPAVNREYFDRLAIKIAGCGEDFGVDPEANKEEFAKRKAVVMDAIGVAKGLVGVFGIAGKGNLYFSTYTEGDQLARLMEFRRGVDADRETPIERKVGASSAVLKADKEGKFALTWLKLGLTYPEFVDIQNSKRGMVGVTLKDGSTSKMMDVVRRGNFYQIDWSRNNVSFEKYLDFLGRSYLVYQMLVDKNPKPDLVNTRDAIKNVKHACSTVVEDVYPSQSAEMKEKMVNDLVYQIFRVVITAHNPLDDDVPKTQWWVDGDFTAALENISRTKVLPEKLTSKLREIVGNRLAIVLKTPSNLKQVVSIDR